MDYDELVSDIVKRVHVRYEDYVQYRESKGFAVDSFDEVVEQLLADELNDSLIYYHQMWTIIEHNCDDVSSLFYDGAATFDGATPYDAFYSDCAKALDI